MPLAIRSLILVALLAGVILTLLKWSRPEARLPARQKALLSAVSSRNWSKVERMMSENYQDRWHKDSAEAIQTLSVIGSNFLTLDTTMLSPVLDLGAADGPEMRGRLELKGAGGGLAPSIIRQVNRLEEPFVFTWEKSGSLPWQWSLVRVAHPELERRPPLNLPVF